MAKPQRIGDLDIDEDISHQRKLWLIERAAWTLMTFVLFAALLGLLGSGPLSSVVLEQPEAGLTVRYNRFERYQAESLIEIDLMPDALPAAAENLPVRLMIRRDFFNDYSISDVVPEPVAVEAGPEYLTYAFARSDAPGPIVISLHISAIGFGQVDVGFLLENHQELSFKQFIYP